MTKAIEKKINNLKRSGANIQTKIHELAIECLEHAAQNEGDFTLMTKLYHALPSIVRRGTFVEWVKAYAPARFITKKSKSGAKIKVFKKSNAKDAPAFDIAGAKAVPIQSFEAPKGTNEAEPLTCEEVNKKILSLMTRLEKQANDTQVLEYVKNTREKLGIVA